MSKRKLNDGNRITFSGCNGTFRFVCCACGLAHDIDFNVTNGKLTLLFKTNIRSTAQFRRHMKPDKKTIEALIANMEAKKNA